MSDNALVAAALPRSLWSALACTMIQEIRDLVEEADGEWDPEKKEELEGCARDHAVKGLPVLLEAYGDGPGGDYPSRDEIHEMARALWDRMDTWPTSRHFQAARQVVKELG